MVTCKLRRVIHCNLSYGYKSKSLQEGVVVLMPTGNGVP